MHFRLLKIGSIAILLLIGSGVIYAQYRGTPGRRPKSKEISRRRVADGTAKGRPNAIREAGPVDGRRIPTRIGSEFHANGIVVESHGRDFSVKFSAEAKGSIPTFSYLWVLRVSDARTKVLLVNRKYEDQVFQLLDDVGRTITLEDSVRMSPGTYTVQVVLYQIPARFDLDKLDDPVATAPYEVVSKRREVVVRG